MRNLLIAFALAFLVAATSAAQLQSDPKGGDLTRGVPSPNGRTAEGGVEFINPGTPVIKDSEINSQPVPKLPDGHIDLTGPWVGGGTVADIERDGGLKPGELPLLPWAKELQAKRRSQDDPYTACLPMSVLRTNPYPWKFVMGYTSKGLSHIYILHELMDDGAHRVVYMDGRKHPAGFIPSWLGHSIGRWDGDALIIESVNFKPWILDDYHYTDATKSRWHTDALKTTERLQRAGNKLQYRITIDDSKIFERPWSQDFELTLRPDWNELGLLEYVCEENNRCPGGKCRASDVQ